VVLSPERGLTGASSPRAVRAARSSATRSDRAAPCRKQARSRRRRGDRSVLRKAPAETLTLVTLPAWTRPARVSWFRASSARNCRQRLPGRASAASRMDRCPARAAEAARKPGEPAVPRRLRRRHLLPRTRRSRNSRFSCPPESSTSTPCASGDERGRYDALKLAKRCSRASARASRACSKACGEGERPPACCGSREEIRAICRVQNGIAAGRSLAEVLREARVWGDARQSLVGRREEAPGANAARRARARAKSIASSKGSSKATPGMSCCNLG